MFGLGMGELVVIFFIILLFFGAKNLPEMAKALGKSVKDFKRAANDIKDSLETDINRMDTPHSAQAPARVIEAQAKSADPSPVIKAS